MPTARPPSFDAIVIVSLGWNGEPLLTRSVRPGETVLLGDAKGALAPLPAEVLGGPSLLLADAGDGPHVRVPDGKVASIRNRSGGLRLVAGPERVRLSPGDEAKLLFGAFELTLAVDLAEAAPRRRRLAPGAWLHTAVVAAVHAALLVAGSRAALAASFEADAGPNVDDLRGYLAAAEERSIALDTVRSNGGGQLHSTRTRGRHGNGKDGGGERSAGDAGKAGATASRAKNRHFGAVAAPEKGSASAASEVEAARDFGMIGLLRTAEVGAVPRMAGASPWSALDPLTTSGGLLGRLTGESEGIAGLSLSGTGEGGGGRGEGIGLGTIGTIGHADGFAGSGTGGAGSSLNGNGFGRSGGRLRGSHRTRPIWDRWGGDFTSVSGRLPPEAVKRVIRSNFGRFRGCYQEALGRNPGLAGRVTTRFVIGRDGSVASVADGGSDLPDAAVGACVRRAFYGISFPQPEGGIVTVIYPIAFSNQ